MLNSKLGMSRAAEEEDEGPVLGLLQPGRTASYLLTKRRMVALRRDEDKSDVIAMLETWRFKHYHIDYLTWPVRPMKEPYRA